MKRELRKAENGGPMKAPRLPGMRRGNVTLPEETEFGPIILSLAIGTLSFWMKHR